VTELIEHCGLAAAPVTRGQVLALQREMSRLPQAELETRHLFADGMYARELCIPAGVLIVGKAHLRDHFFLLTKGRLRVTTAEGRVEEISAPCAFASPAGAKRAGLALEDSVCVTVHRTDATDLNTIESELIEPDAEALFDSANKLLEVKI
jgi:quercetin dioxygenase-like cupin family protein